ncbi:hypothetical protein [Actinokineospora sp. NPDC004072]
MTVGVAPAAAQQWSVVTGETRYLPETSNVSSRVTYSCPQAGDGWNSGGVIYLEVRQGSIAEIGRLNPVKCPAEEEHATIYLGAGGPEFNRDQLAHVRAVIGFGEIDRELVGENWELVSTEYTSEWRSVCLYGGDAQYCPQ